MAKINLEYFHEFLVLADTRNYLQAADLLFISQSTLSRHILAMEQELGFSLFTRTTRRVMLTDSGRALIPYAAQISDAQYGYTSALIAHSRQAFPTVNVGTIPMLPYYGIGELLAEYRRAYPAFGLKIHEDAPLALYESLRLHRCDFAFVMEGKCPSPEFARMPFLRDQMCLLVPSGHPLATKKRVRPAQLAAETFLSLSAYTLLKQASDAALAHMGIRTKVICGGSRIDQLAERVAQGEGVAIIMKRTAELITVENVTAVALSPEVQANINLVYCRGGSFSIPAKHFMEYVSRSLAAPQ